MGNYLIELQRVSKEFSSDRQTTTVLQDVSMKTRAGELVLILGPSGSGKTTLLMLMAGLIQPTRGEVMILSRNVRDYTHRQIQEVRAQRIGFVFQAFLLMNWLTVEENIEIVKMFAGRRNLEAQQSKDLKIRLGIDHLAKKMPLTLSQGEKQRVAVARAFINNPDIVLADEPTASLDLDQGSQIIRMLRYFAKRYNSSVVVASHDIRIRTLADRILRIENGRLR